MSSRVLRTTRKENKTRLTIDKVQAFSQDKDTDLKSIMEFLDRWPFDNSFNYNVIIQVIIMSKEALK